MIKSIVARVSFRCCQEPDGAGASDPLLTVEKLNSASWYRQRVAHPCRASARAIGGACYKQNPFALFSRTWRQPHACVRGGYGRLGYYRCERRNMAGET